MTANIAPYHSNSNQDRKNTDIIEKDIRKWVESVVEFKANLDKQRNEAPLENHIKKVKKIKVKKKPSLLTVPIGNAKAPASVSKITLNENSHQLFNEIKGQRKSSKAKKPAKSSANQANAEKPKKKEPEQTNEKFESIKESFKTMKLPQNWTSGISNGRIVFNRIKMTVFNSQQKMSIERSIIITKDRNVHVLINGSEINLTNMEVQKIETLDDIKKAIKEIDALKICGGPRNGSKNPQCSLLINNKLKTCQACKSEPANPQKVVKKKPQRIKKSGGEKVAKQTSFQK